MKTICTRAQRIIDDALRVEVKAEFDVILFIARNSGPPVVLDHLIAAIESIKSELQHKEDEAFIAMIDAWQAKLKELSSETEKDMEVYLADKTKARS